MPPVEPWIHVPLPTLPRRLTLPEPGAALPRRDAASIVRGTADVVPAWLPECPPVLVPTASHRPAAVASRAALHAELRAIAIAPRCAGHAAIGCNTCTP